MMAQEAKWTLNLLFHQCAKYVILPPTSNGCPGFKLVKTYETSLRGFTKILPLNNNQAIISCWKDEVLQKVSFGKHNMTVETNYPKIKVDDIAVMKNGDILLSKQESELKLLCEKGAIESFHSFSPFKTFGIHVNNENDIVVGLASSSDGGDGKIVVLDSNGIVKEHLRMIRTKTN
ncbi:unnamed protein product [Mytilus edulis]|uniref:Uncharacterized protein n=1 Tax=Mytilus edulis TaxID=6550 RepID=A0A8S3SPN6_MYTED|nr:unnamed protein product [Mytilus edulis]